LAALLLLTSYFADIVLGSSQFGSLLLALFLLTVSLFSYEALRRGAILELGSWEAIKVRSLRRHVVSKATLTSSIYGSLFHLQLKAVAKDVYLDFSTYHETLKEKLSRGAVDVTAEDPPDETTDDRTFVVFVGKRGSLFDPIQDVLKGNPSLASCSI